MRRLLSIPLLAVFLLGPLAALLPGLNEAPLPACCRRHGAHHCAMSDDGSSLTAPGHFLTAPSHCPLYSKSGPATPSVFLLPGHPRLINSAQAQVYTACSNAASLQRARIRAQRGPPAAL